MGYLFPNIKYESYIVSANKSSNKPLIHKRTTPGHHHHPHPNPTHSATPSSFSLLFIFRDINIFLLNIPVYTL